MLATAVCADEYLDFEINGRIVRLKAFEAQFTFAMFAVRGWQRFNEVAQMLPPSFDRASHRAGDAKKGPVR